MDAHLPRAALRDPIRFELSSIHTYLTRRMVAVFDKAMRGEIEKDAAPGYAIGVKIGLGVWERTAPAPKSADGERGPVTINVAIFSSESDPARHEAASNGLALRFSGGNGAEP